jgi:hypothetical protein
MNVTLIGASSGREGNRSGRRPESSDSSATLADLLAERTEENVATARTRVPAAVANDDAMTQSFIGPS